MTAQPTAMDQIKDELKLFFEFCKENYLTDQEIFRICKPILVEPKRSKIDIKAITIFVLLFVGTTIYFLTHFDALSWHASAIGRLSLIEVLPYWDWRYMKNEKCLIPNSFVENEITELAFDCALCEAIDKITIESDINQEYLKEHYLELHNPVIIANALENWKMYPNYTFTNNESFLSSIPCKLSTNVHNGLTNVGEILDKLQNFETFFLHFQNCDFKAMKEFRTVTPKPKFLPIDMSPVQYSWILISKNYDVDKFKTIDLRESVTVIGQRNGSNFFQLTPRRNCESECSTVHVELLKGEALVFTSMWNLEYKTNVAGENFAVILEMH